MLDTGSGAQAGYHDGDRFPMCSTFKLLAGAAVLKRVDEGKETLDKRIKYQAGDLVDLFAGHREARRRAA